MRSPSRDRRRRSPSPPPRVRDIRYDSNMSRDRCHFKSYEKSATITSGSSYPDMGNQTVSSQPSGQQTAGSGSKQSTGQPNMSDRTSGQPDTGHHGAHASRGVSDPDQVSLYADSRDPLYQENIHSDKGEESEPDSAMVTEVEQPSLTFEQACEDCFSLLPSDFCPRPTVDSQLGPRSTSEKLLSSAGAIQERSVKASLPLSGTVPEILNIIEPHNTDKGTAGWAIPSSVTKSLAPNASLRLPSVTRGQFQTAAIPGLDTDAHTVRLSRPGSLPISTSYLERWELRQRQQVGLLSNADLFAAALTQMSQEPNPSVDVLRRLALHVGRATRQLLGLALSNTAEMVRVRRDATLETSSLLLPSSKEVLRRVPLSSDHLFGGKVQEVAASDREQQIHVKVAAPQTSTWKIPKRTAPETPKGASAAKKPKTQKGNKRPSASASSGKTGSFPKKGNQPSKGKSPYKPKASNPSAGSSGNQP